jgi:hypothetical protein
MKKILIPLVCAILCLGLYLLYEKSTLFFSSSINDNNYQLKSEYSFKTFPTSNKGWGYSILKKDIEIIHQDEIPAVQGNASFKNEADAEKVAGLVVSKLNAAEIPTVSKGELAALGIAVK